MILLWLLTPGLVAFWYCYTLVLHLIQYLTLYCWTDYIGGLGFLVYFLSGFNHISQNVLSLSILVQIDLRLSHYDRASLRDQCWVLFSLVFMCCLLDRLFGSMVWNITAMQMIPRFILVLKPMLHSHLKFICLFIGIKGLDEAELS